MVGAGALDQGGADILDLGAKDWVGGFFIGHGLDRVTGSGMCALEKASDLIQSQTGLAKQGHSDLAGIGDVLAVTGADQISLADSTDATDGGNDKDMAIESLAAVEFAVQCFSAGVEGQGSFEFSDAFREMSDRLVNRRRIELDGDLPCGG